MSIVTITITSITGRSLAAAAVSCLLAGAAGCAADGALDFELEPEAEAIADPTPAPHAEIQLVDTPPPLRADAADPGVAQSNVVGTQFERFRVLRTTDALGAWIEYQNGSAPLHVSACNPNGTPCCLSDLSVCFTDNSSTGEDGELQLSLDGVTGGTCAVTHRNTKEAAVFQYNRRGSGSCIAGSACLKLRRPGTTGLPLKGSESVDVVCF